jgi:hypothetical protein
MGSHRCPERSAQVFARINFLLGLGLLILLAFYFAAVYLLIPALAAVAPGWVRPAAGMAILAAVGLTVQLLSGIALTNLRGVALYEKGEKPSLPAYASQGLMLLSHIALVCTVSALFYGKPVDQGQLFAITAAYLVATGFAIAEWRQRMLARI